MRIWTAKIWLAVCLSIALGACASGERAETLASGGAAAEPVRYDAARAERLVQDAQEAAARGDPAAAEAAFEGALDAWPTSKPAWDGLAKIYLEQDRQEDFQVANFFAARMDWVATLPPLIASSGFENVSEGRVQIAQEIPELRRRSGELVAFLRTRAVRTKDGVHSEELDIWELVPAAAVGAIILVGGIFGS